MLIFNDCTGPAALFFAVSGMLIGWFWRGFVERMIQKHKERNGRIGF